MMEALQRFDQQVVKRKPYRTAPVRIASKQLGVRFGRLVIDPMLLPVHIQDERMIPVITRQRADAIWREELVLIKHSGENLEQLRALHYRKEPSLAHALPGDGSDVAAKILAVLNEPVHTALEPGHAVDLFLLDS